MTGFEITLLCGMGFSGFFLTAQLCRYFSIRVKILVYCMKYSHLHPNISAYVLKKLMTDREKDIYMKIREEGIQQTMQEVNKMIKNKIDTDPEFKEKMESFQKEISRLIEDNEDEPDSKS